MRYSWTPFERIEARETIQQLVNEYSYRLNTSDFAGMADLFCHSETGKATSYGYLLYKPPHFETIQVNTASVYRDTFKKLEGEWVFDTREIEIQLESNTSPTKTYVVEN